MLEQVAIRINPRVARALMARKPLDRSKRFKILATGIVQAAHIAFDTMLITGMRECWSNPLTT